MFRSLHVEKQGDLDPPEYEGMTTVGEIFEKTYLENSKLNFLGSRERIFVKDETV